MRDGSVRCRFFPPAGTVASSILPESSERRMTMGRTGMGRATALCAVLAALALATGARADCPDDAAVEALAADVLARRSSPPLDVASIEDGLCAQAKLVTLLEREWGPPVGYKTGLTNPGVQQAFGYHEPVRGVLLSGTIGGTSCREHVGQYG